MMDVLRRWFGGDGLGDDAAPRSGVAALEAAVAARCGGLARDGCDAAFILDAMAGVTAADLNIESAAALDAALGRRAAVWYVPVVEAEAYSICAFVFAPNATIPLHDHPEMAVLSRCLAGSVSVASFDAPRGGGRVRGRRTTALAAGAGAALFPEEYNFHEFVAGPDGAVVLEVIAPPYDDGAGRSCAYFAVVGEDLVRLDGDDEPDFECLTAPVYARGGHPPR